MGGFLGKVFKSPGSGGSASLSANLFEGLTGVNVDPDPLGMRKKNTPPDTSNADALARIATDLYNKTDPLRTSLISRGNDFLSGNLDVTSSPMFASLKNSVDSQFRKARENTLGTTPAGGSLTAALSGLEGTRANAMTQGIGDLAKSEMDRAFGLATGILPQTTSGLGAAAGIQSNLFAQQQAQNAQAKQGAGAGLGMIMAML